MIPFIGNFNEATYRQDQINWLGDLLDFLSQHNKILNSTMLDIGANTGTITDQMIQAQTKDEFDIICVEPDPELYDHLQNKYRDRDSITVYPWVMNDVSQDAIDFYCSVDRPGSSHVRFTPDSVQSVYQKISRCAKTIDDLCQDLHRRCSFIKIDAEGHDFWILRGAEQVLTRDRPVVLFEFCGLMACERYGFSPTQWYRFFQHIGYRLLSPIGHHDEKFILAHYGRFCPDLVDLLAIPAEHYLKYTQS
jgi:FkbM family methyltransferase